MARRGVEAVLAVSVVALVGAGCSGGTGSSGKAGTPTSQNGGPSAIEVARSASRFFSIFPVRVATRDCRIPRGGPASTAAMAFRGTCSTALTAERRGRAVVTFTERWRNASRSFRHAWAVTVDSTGKVSTIRLSGAVAPQLWR
jgi:hypothetical protein